MAALAQDVQTMIEAEYLLIAQDSPRIERFLRQEDGARVFNDAVGRDSSLALTSLDVTLALAEV